MLIRHLPLLMLCIFLSSFSARADEFTVVDQPVFKEIEPRMVYGEVVYDFTFKGPNNKTRTASATDFLKNAIKSKFSNKSGSYIVTLDVSLGNTKIISEPILTATWQKEKFLFVTTGEKTSLVVNKNGVLLEDLPVDNETNKLKFALSIYRNENSSFDLSLFKELSGLSKNSYLSKISPGLTVANEIYKPFEAIFGKLLSSYNEANLVEIVVGAFTLLDDGFGNQLRYDGSRFALNVYLKTENSQLNGNFSAGKFSITNHELVLAAVKSGIGAARAPVVEIISAGGPGIDQGLTGFIRAITSGKPFNAGYQTEHIRPSCGALKSKLNTMLTTRDASLVYWAFLTMHSAELVKYPDGKSCADQSMMASLKQVGLTLDSSTWGN